jgi:DNA-directed RNA polymerase specialized sigma24 family protein
MGRFPLWLSIGGQAPRRCWFPDQPGLVQPDFSAYAATIHAPRGEQHWASELTDIQRALVRVHIEQREALILVAVAGFSYEERRA